MKPHFKITDYCKPITTKIRKIQQYYMQLFVAKFTQMMQ